MFVKDQMGYLTDMKKTKIVCSSHFQKLQTWCAHAYSGMFSKSWVNLCNLMTLHYLMGLGMPKATIDCPGDNHGVRSVMDKYNFQGKRIGPRGKPILMGA